MFHIPASSLQLVWSPTAQSGVLRVPSAGCWFSLLHLYSNWLTSGLHPSYIIVRHPPSSYGRHKSNSIQPVHGQGYILIFLDRMHLLFTQVHFLFWQLGRGQYVIKLNYYYYYYSYSWRVFHISVSRWSFTEVWVTSSLLKSPGLFSVFWSISTIQ